MATALVASFRANDVTCQFGQCTFAAGQAVSFVDSSLGATFWDYDWTHTSASAQTCNFTDYKVSTAASPFGTCGKTRGPLGNWATRISRVRPGERDDD